MILAKILDNTFGTYLEQFWKRVQKLALVVSWLAFATAWLALVMGQALGTWARLGPGQGPRAWPMAKASQDMAKASQDMDKASFWTRFQNCSKYFPNMLSNFFFPRIRAGKVKSGRGGWGVWEILPG